MTESLRWKILDLSRKDETDPLTNLCIEELLWERDQGFNLLLLYENSDCFVIGKNQNPWLELDLDWFKENGISFFRRSTGGGTVYHGKGNLIFSFTERSPKRKLIPMSQYNELLIQTCSNMGFDLDQDKRNCLFLEGKKVSGNAQGLKGDRCLSHGTLLVNADLNMLEAGQSKNSQNLNTKAIASVRSKVANLSPKDQSTFYDEFSRELKGMLNAETISLEELDINKKSLSKRKEQRNAWHWRYGKTPEFSTQKKLPSGKKANLIFFGGILSKIEIEGEKPMVAPPITYESPSIKEYLEKL